jgi:hypothetical protein
VVVSGVGGAAEAPPGDRDQYYSAADLTRQLAGIATPKTQCILTGADHFLFGHESAIAATVSSFVA